MPTRKKPAAAPRAEEQAPPLRGSLGLPFISAQEFIKEADMAGLAISEKGAGRMKIPQLLNRGKAEKYEFFDLESRPPQERGENDSPSYCYDKRMPAPAWVSNWYLSITEEGGNKFVTFVYPPKKVFVKCPIADTERAILSAMWEKSLGQ